MDLQRTLSVQTKTRTLTFAGLAALVTSVLISVAASNLPGVDWYTAFRPAALHLTNPYADNFYGPPWVLLPIIPLSWFPARLGRGLFFVLSLAGFSLAIYRLGAKPAVLAIFLLSPPVMHSLLNANIDWIPILGATLPPQYGLFLVSAKPQMGAPLALFWLIDTLMRDGFKRTMVVFAPCGLALLASFAIYGLWPLRFSVALDYSYMWNASFWPQSIPVGLAVLAASLRKRDFRLALGSGPLLSPYTLFHSWSAPLAGLAQHPGEMAAAVAGLWLLMFLRQ